MGKVMRFIFVMSIVILFLVGCASWNTQVTTLSKDMIANLDANRKVCKAIAKGWPLYTNVIKEALKPEITNETVTEIGIIDAIVASNPNPDKWTDAQCGQACGAWDYIWQRLPQAGARRILTMIAEWAALAAQF